MAVEDQAPFQPLVDWTKAACIRRGMATQGDSQLSVPWRDVRTSQRFVGWASSQLENFYPGMYPTLIGAPPGLAANPFAGFSAEALTQASQQ
jgi:hypothetical protein